MHARDYFPPPESQGGWRRLTEPEEIRRRRRAWIPAKLDELREWLLKSDNRDFAAVVIRHGYIVLEVERGNSAKTDSRRVASVSKAVCATVLAIASEWSQQGRTPRKMTFDDRAFDFIPWAQPLSDPAQGADHRQAAAQSHLRDLSRSDRRAQRRLVGIHPRPQRRPAHREAGVRSGHGLRLLDARARPRRAGVRDGDRQALRPVRHRGACSSRSASSTGGSSITTAAIGRHPSHGLGMPARDLARIAYCMMRGGRWGDRQVIPKWFVEETAAPTTT